MKRKPKVAKTIIGDKKDEAKKLVEDHSENTSENVIDKFQKHGFNALTIEDLVVTMANSDFAELFKQKTGEDWDTKYKPKVMERLENAKSDLGCLVKKDTSNTQFAPLFELCKTGSIEKVKEYIKKHGSDTLFVIDKSMKSPLHIAAANGHSKLVETLVNLGSNLESKDKCRRTPLQLGANAGHLTVVDTLISLGADLLTKDSV